MGAPAKVSDRQILEALNTWRGNITSSAESLGISRRALKKRMVSMGLFRDPWSQVGPMEQMGPLGMVGPLVPAGPVGTMETTDNHWAKTPAGNYRKRQSRTIFRFMPTLHTDEMQARTGKPPIKLRPDQIDALREAKFDFQAKHRVEAGESDLLQKFFDESFTAWLKRCLDREPRK